RAVIRRRSGVILNRPIELGVPPIALRYQVTPPLTPGRTLPMARPTTVNRPGVDPRFSPGGFERIGRLKGGAVMLFQGEVLSVAELLDAARTTPETAPSVGVRHTTAQNAAACRILLASVGSLDERWRFGILQTLDDYNSTLRRGGPDLVAGVFTDEPLRTGAVEVDAAFAALAEYLA